ncbi:MAG: DUF362 domain-containing protein [Cyanobacteria bacterium]|nr:DUF362 domain-containing protein [Cyanobacteriota bacterium]
MKNIFERFEKKLIIKNKIFLKKGFPRLPKNIKHIKLTFTGNFALKDFTKSGSVIFKDFNSRTSVLIKINLNSSNNYPASTSPEMLEAVIKLLVEQGVKKICVGDCSGLMHLPTRKVIKKKDLFFLNKKYGVKIIVFDYGGWVNIPIKGEHFKNIILSNNVYKYDRIVNLANLKSHIRSKFSFSTKLLVGFMHPYQRFELHNDHIEERIAEISLAVKPDISIIDARKIFIDGGPDSGVTVPANTIIVDTNLFEADLKAYELLYLFKKQSGIDDIGQNPLNNIFFKHFIKINNLDI